MPAVPPPSCAGALHTVDVAGFGSADGKTGPNATKELIGDALRNAAMRFGVALDDRHPVIEAGGVCEGTICYTGNILDPNSEVAHILREKRVFVLKEEVGTLPRFFYYFDV